MNKFTTFLQNLKTQDNSILIESITNAYNIIYESFEQHDVVIVDIQPSYADYFTFDIYEFTNYLNEYYNTANRILYLYNGEEFGMESKHDIIIWLLENGLDEEVIDNIDFYEKNYAFFRNAMDSYISYSSITKLIKFMMNHDINDSRDLDEATWNVFKENNEDDNDIIEFLKDNDDMINVPDLMEKLQSISNPIVMGGGKDECLAEVLIAMDVLDIQYKILSKFVY